MTNEHIHGILLEELNSLTSPLTTAPFSLPDFLPSASGPSLSARSPANTVSQLLRGLARAAAPPPLISLLPHSSQREDTLSSSHLSALLAPAVSGIVSALRKLFGSSTPASAPPPLRYLSPPALRLTQGVSADYGPRPITIDKAAEGLPRLDRSNTLLPAPHITVNVQAIDQRSFLDHSTEIANALRQALLQAHSLTDVLTDY